MDIATFTEHDIASLPDLQPPDWQDVTPYFQYYLQSAAAFPLKAVIDSQTVGVGTVLVHEDTAWLAHIIVHPGYRNKGIGRVLTQALLDSIDKTVFKTIYLMATPLGEPLYRKLGFVAETEQLFMKDGKSFADHIVRPQIIPLSDRYMDAVFQMDREVSGENRVARLNEGLGSAMIYAEDGHMLGYYMPQLGEGVVVAKDTEAGLQLMQYRLMAHDVAILNTDNKPAVDFLYGKGFKVFRKATRMRLGAYRPWQASCVYNRVSGQLG